MMGGMMKPPVHLARVVTPPSHRLCSVSGGDLVMVVPPIDGHGGEVIKPELRGCGFAVGECGWRPATPLSHP